MQENSVYNSKPMGKFPCDVIMRFLPLAAYMDLLQVLLEREIISLDEHWIPYQEEEVNNIEVQDTEI